MSHPETTHHNGIHDSIKVSEASSCKEGTSDVVNAEPTLCCVNQTVAHLNARERGRESIQSVCGRILVSARRRISDRNLRHVLDGNTHQSKVP